MRFISIAIYLSIFAANSFGQALSCSNLTVTNAGKIQATAGNLCFSSSTGAVDFFDGIRGYWFRIYNAGDPAINFNASGDGWMDTPGKFGFGTRTPSSTVEVRNSTSITAFKASSYSGTGIIAESVRGTALQVNGTLLVSSSTGPAGNLNVEGTISTNNFSSNNCYVRGQIRGQEVVVTMIGWPDYVFEKEYKLMPLSVVKDSVNKYKHLPGIPSMDDILKNGANVGDVQALLLKKIEELTLYTISLQEQVDQLKSKK